MEIWCFHYGTFDSTHLPSPLQRPVCQYCLLAILAPGFAVSLLGSWFESLFTNPGASYESLQLSNLLMVSLYWHKVNKPKNGNSKCSLWQLWQRTFAFPFATPCLPAVSSCSLGSWFWCLLAWLLVGISFYKSKCFIRKLAALQSPNGKPLLT